MSAPVSKRERLRSLFTHGHLHGPNSHPPRTSQTRNLPPGLSLRSSPSPSLRPTHEVLQEDLPDDVDIEFLSLDDSDLRYDEEPNEDLDTINERDRDDEIEYDGQDTEQDNDDEDDDMADWPEDSSGTSADEAVHIDGVPRSEIRLEARQYKQPSFSESLLAMLRDELKVTGWADLPKDAPTSQMNVHKVSGSLTNAVFFISFPQDNPEVGPPTVLLRIYGPSSGNLVSRRKELHVLYTLSASYAIGPAIFGTFSNGRVEEYFESRALYKEEMRDPRTSRWIARRMRELHGVDLPLMELPFEPVSASPSPGPHVFTPSRKSLVDFSPHGLTPVQSTSGASSHATRPPPAPLQAQSVQSQPDSSTSVLSTSSASSIFSVSSNLSSSSGSTFGGFSPRLTARSASRPGVSEGSAPRKKRSSSSLGSNRSSFSLEGDKWMRPRSVIWQNIDSWTQEARKVLRRTSTLASGDKKLGSDTSSIASENAIADSPEILLQVNPLLCPSFLKEAKKRLDLKLFQREVKAYKRYIERFERENFKSKRVFAHNDAQCGNLLRLTPGGKDEMVPGLRFPHEMIIVVDFEYAGVNPRGLDIANHFLEWQTDYHHSTLSHSLSAHGAGPTLLERQRFYRAYVPVDGGYDEGGAEPVIPDLENDDPRVQRLEQEVRLWTAASHAMYAVWSIVQATDDIKARIDGWAQDPESAAQAEELGRQVLQHRSQIAATDRPKLRRGKSGETIADNADEARQARTEEAENEQNGHEGTGSSQAPELPNLGDFDYVGYALERIRMFRQEMANLQVPV